MKGLAVVFMVQVHLMELFARQEVFDGPLGRLSLFLGGPPAAPVFMVVMGYYLASTKRPFLSGLSRGAKLLLWGLLLNIGINLHLLLHIFTGESTVEPLDYIFGADILFLAGFGVILLTALKRVFRDRLWLWIATLMLVLLISQFGSSFITDSSWKYVLALFGGDYPWSYFPVFPWLAYPLTGYLFYLLQDRLLAQFQRKRRMFDFTAGSGILVFLSLNYAIGISHDLPRYYHHGILFFLWILLFLSFYTALVSLVSQWAPLLKIVNFLTWCGRNVTAMYVFQWLLIGNLGTWLYKTQATWQLWAWFVVVMGCSCGLTYAWTSLRRPKTKDIL